MPPTLAPATSVPVTRRAAALSREIIARASAPAPQPGERGHLQHTLRHSAASELIRAGEDLGTVGALLGHKSPASSKRYAHWQVERLAEAVGKIGRR